MHDCSYIQEKLFDYSLGELGATEAARLLKETADCPLCKAELASIEKTLSLYEQTAEAFEPSAADWRNYETALLSKFQPSTRAGISPSLNGLWGVLFSSVRVPVPVMAAVAIAVGFAFFAFRPANVEEKLATVPVETPAPVVIEKPAPERIAEKVVVRERVVTKKIYVNKQRDVKQRRVENTDFSPLNLAEFKPVKPSPQNTVQGGATNEK